jgi:trimethylamine--corrinoid protein Co-methyltransferase
VGTGPNQRSRSRRQKAPTPVRDVSYLNLVNTFPRHRVFSEDEVENIHLTALRVLRDLGIRVLLKDGRDAYAKAGARVDEDTKMVFLDPDMVTELVAKAPSAFTLRGGSPEKDIHVGGDSIMFGPGGGCPNITDLDRGRRPGTSQDHNDMVRLTQSFDVIPKLAPCVEPQDIPINFRHYDAVHGYTTLSDKIPFIYSRGRYQTAECFEMMAIARGVSMDDFHRDIWCTTLINTNSPRQIDVPMTRGIMDFAAAGQVLVITPFCLSGAMAPITIAGALTLSHAEAMAGIALAQIVNPGAPCVYGAFSSNVDMRSGAPAFGTPEHLKSNVGAGQLARKLNLPWRSGAGSSSNAADVQADYENLLALWGAVMGGSNLIYHSAGWIEGGLTISMEKFVTDAEVLQGIAESFLPVACGEDEISFDAIAEVEPGGHFFAAKQTMERYSTAFYQPFVSDLANFGQWSDAGAKTATERANGIWKEKLANFTPPKSAEVNREELEAYIAVHKAKGGAPLEDG